MCMNDPERILSKDVPKYAYKVYEPCLGENVLFTPYYKQVHTIGKFNKAIDRKKSHNTIRHCPTALHQGRISVFC